jgi:glucose-1-phosphate cytidylyltransferase
MPICGTPILVHLMRIYADYGVRRFVLASGHRREILVDYFDGRFSNWDVRIVDTGAEADTGERLRRCAPYVGETFFATYGDGLGDVNLHRLLAHHRACGALATVTTVPLPSQYGTLHFGTDGRVERFVEKPILREHWINAGFFVLERRGFDFWEGSSFERDALPRLSALGRVFAYRHEGFWKSMDTSKDQQELEGLVARGAAPAWRRTADGVDIVPAEKTA